MENEIDNKFINYTRNMDGDGPDAGKIEIFISDNPLITLNDESELSNLIRNLKIIKREIGEMPY